MAFPNLDIPGNGGRLQTGFDGGQVSVLPILGDEGCSGWLRFGFIDRDHVLGTQFEHGRAGYAIMIFVTIAKLMGHTFSHPINSLEVANEEAVAGFVDRALLVVASHTGILFAS